MIRVMVRIRLGIRVRQGGRIWIRIRKVILLLNVSRVGLYVKNLNLRS